MKLCLKVEQIIQQMIMFLIKSLASQILALDLTNSSNYGVRSRYHIAQTCLYLGCKYILCWSYFLVSEDSDELLMNRPSLAKTWLTVISVLKDYQHSRLTKHHVSLYLSLALNLLLCLSLSLFGSENTRYKVFSSYLLKYLCFKFIVDVIF